MKNLTGLWFVSLMKTAKQLCQSTIDVDTFLFVAKSLVIEEGLWQNSALQPRNCQKALIMCRIQIMAVFFSHVIANSIWNLQWPRGIIELIKPCLISWIIYLCVRVCNLSICLVSHCITNATCTIYLKYTPIRDTCLRLEPKLYFLST